MTTDAPESPMQAIPEWLRPLLPDWVGGLRDRATNLDDVEILSRAKGGDGRTVTAYAAVFDSPTEVRDIDGHYLEQIHRSAFDQTIRQRAGKINVFYNHGKDLYGQPSDRFAVPIGTPREITADTRGLRTVTQYNRTALADEVLEAIKSGSVRGMSFTGGLLRSDPPNGPYYARSGELTLVTRQEIALIEYGPTPIPNYDDAEVVGVRSGQLDEDVRQRAVSDRPWSSFTQADYSPQQWARACLLDTGQGDVDSKDRYKLPVREPDGAYNRGGIHAAAGGHGVGAVTGVSPEKKQAAARSLVGLYRSQLKEDPPPSLLELAGMSTSSSRTASIEEPAAPSTDPEDDAQPAQEPPTHSEEPGTPDSTPQAEPAPAEPPRRTSVDEQSMTVAERSVRIDEISARMQEIASTYTGELPGEVDEEWNRIDDELKAHQRAVAADTRRRERIAQLAAEQDQGGERVNAERAGYGGQAPAFHRKPENIFDLGEIRQRARSIDELPALYRENAMRAVDVSRYPGLVRMPGVTKEQAQARVRELLDGIDAEAGEDAGALARRILVTGSPTYERAFWKAIARGGFMGLNAEEQRALSMGSATSAQLAVPFTLDPTIILTSDGATNPLRQISRVETITGRTWEGVTSAGITVGRIGEALPSTDNAPSLAQPTLTPTAVRGFVPFSIETDQDWTQMRSEMTRLLADAKDVEEAAAFVTGSGSAPAPSGIQATLTTASNVNDGSGGFTAAAIFSMENNLPPRFTPRASWLARKNTYNLVRALDTNGTLYARITAGRANELIGYPAYEASAMPVRFTSSTVFGGRYAILGDFSNFLIVDKAGMDVELVPHLFSNNLPTGQRGLFALWRNNSLVVNGNAFRILVYAT